MSEPKYKLIYFNAKGRAEPIRIMFHLAGQTFEDVRIDYDKWPQFRNGDTAPFGQLPVLEIDGFKLPQSLAISRYVAKKFGFGGTTPLEQAEVDSYVDLTNDLLIPWLPVLNLKSDNADIKEYLVKQAVNRSVEILGYFEKRLMERDFLVGAGLTAADLQLMCILNLLVQHMEQFPSLKEFPAVRAHDIRVRETPKVDEWIRNRPHEQF